MAAPSRPSTSSATPSATSPPARRPRRSPRHDRTPRRIVQPRVQKAGCGTPVTNGLSRVFARLRWCPEGMRDPERKAAQRCETKRNWRRSASDVEFPLNAGAGQAGAYGDRRTARARRQCAHRAAISAGRHAGYAAPRRASRNAGGADRRCRPAHHGFGLRHPGSARDIGGRVGRQQSAEGQCRTGPFQDS